MGFENRDGLGEALAYDATLKGMQFLGSGAGKTSAGTLYGFDGNAIIEATLTVGATATRADGQRADGSNVNIWTVTSGGANLPWSDLWAGFIPNTADASIYVKESPLSLVVTSTNGRTIAANMPIGIVPKRLYDSYYGSDALPVGAATSANQLTLINQSPYPRVKTVAPTIQAAAYAAGSCLGGLQTITTANLASALATKLNSIQVNDKGGHSPAITIYFLNSSPAGTFTDKVAIAFAAADILLIEGQISFVFGDYKTPPGASTFSAANRSLIGQNIGIAATSLYMVIQVDTGFTPSSVSDINVKLGLD